MEKVENQASNIVSQEIVEPENSDNNTILDNNIVNKPEPKIQGQSTDPSKDLILGKFKNIEELSKAYRELEKYQGEKSKELGELRKNNSSMSDFAENMQKVIDLKEQMQGYLDEYRNKYNKPEYFQNQEFRNIYKEAFKSLGQNLDTDKFIELLENYVKSRITNYNKVNFANAETQKLVDAMTYEKNIKNSLTPPKKSFDEMTEKEIDELLDKVI